MAKKNKNVAHNPQPQHQKQTIAPQTQEKEEPQLPELVEPTGETVLSTVDPVLSVYEQDHYFGVRKLTSKRSNSALLYERFGYKWGQECKQPNCQVLLDKDNGKKVGVIPCIPVRLIWKKASDWAKGKPESVYSLTQKEWDAALRKFEAYFERKRQMSGGEKVNRPWLVNDILGTSEFDFQQMFFEKADKIILLIDGAIKADIEQSEYLLKKWKKIKIYLHKVHLDKAHGGIFSDADAAILRAHGLLFLNDVKSYNVYQLKNMLLDHDFNDLHKQINAAYKEDLARRKDVRYKIYPFACGLPLLLTMTIIGYICKYTLLKNVTMTAVLLGVLLCWATALGAILWAIYRVKLRRKKRPDYVYLTKRVKGVLLGFSLFSLFAVGSLGVFYERYDGYNDELYYRNLSDGTIAVAGLVKDELNDVYIPETIDGKTVTEIDLWAFKGDDIHYVSMPSTITTVDKKAFYECANLETVKLSESLQAISKKQFANCESLKTLIVPESVTEIGKKAFENCSSLEYVQLPTTIESIGKKAFSACSRMDGVFELTSLQTLGKQAFEYCDSLTAITLGTAQEVIPEEAFRNCWNLRTVEGLGNIRTIEKSAFAGCNYLGNVTFGDQLEEIQEEAFDGCYRMDTLIVPNSLQTMGEDAFIGCTGLRSVSVPFLGEKRGKNKKASLSYAVDCSWREGGMTVSLTDTETIYQKSFEDCEAVKEIRFGDSVTEIKEGAFMDASGLQALYLPDNITNLEKDTFKNCTSLTTVAGGASLLSIGESAFEGCYNLENVAFPSVQTIGASAFSSCSELLTVALPALEYIDANAFSGCIGLTTVGDLPNLKTIRVDAFNGCTSLYNIHLSAGVTEIDEGAFRGSYFETITVSETLQTIGKNAFANNGYLKELDFSHTQLSSIGENAFESCAELTRVNFPATLTAIPEEAFRYDGNLKTVVFNGDIQSIGKKAFYNSGLQELKNLSGVQEIGEEAFYACYNLETITLPTSLQSMGKDVFKDCNALRTVEIPFVGEKPDSKKEGFVYTFGNNSYVTALTLTGMSEISTKLFNNADRLQTLSLNEGVTEIKKEAFKDLYWLTSINFPTTLETIGDSAFRDCDSLKEIHLKDSSVHKLGKDVFRDCDLLQSLSLPSSLTKIPTGTAMGCYNLRSFELEVGVREIGNSAFRGSGLTELPDLKSVEIIGKDAFRDCDSLHTIVVPDYVEKIGKNAFADCAYLTSAQLPFLGKSRGNGWYGYKHVFGGNSPIGNIILTDTEKVSSTMFNGANNLYTLVLNEGLTSIAKNAFAGLHYLESVGIPASLQSIGNNAFKNCYDLVEMDLQHTAVTSFGKNVFRGCSRLRLLTLPNALEEIPDGTARDCHNLSEFVIGDNVKKIGDNAFRSTAFYTLPDLKNVEVIGNNAFYDCWKLQEIVISDNVQKMGKNAFGGCDVLRDVSAPFIGKSRDNNKKGFKYTFGNSYSITSITLTDLEKVDSGTFEGADSLSRIYLNGGVKRIGNSAFKGASNLIEITLPSSLEYVGADAFRNCSSLRSVNLEQASVTEIGKNAFRNCEMLETLILPKTLEVISNSLARDCENLQDIVIPDTVKEIGNNAFKNCMNLQEYTGRLDIPDSVEKIGNSAFENCYSLEEIIFGSGLKELGNRAFTHCHVVSEIRLPEGLQKIGRAAFKNCFNLDRAYVSSTVVKMGANIFRNCDDLYELSIPYIGSSQKFARRLTYITNNYEDLTYLEITNAVKIAKKAAKRFEKLRTVSFNVGLEVIGEGAFTDCYYLDDVYIPDMRTQYTGAFSDYGPEIHLGTSTND